MLVLVGCLVAAPPAAGASIPNTWQATAPMGAARANAHTAILRGGRVLVAGGFAGRNASPVVAVETYDPSTGRWSSTAPAPRASLWPHLATLADGRVLYVAGDFRTDALLPNQFAQVYDPAQNSWATAARPLANHLAPASVVRLLDGRALVVDAPTTELYDPGRDAWTALPAPPAGPGSTALLADGRVLTVGTAAGAYFTTPPSTSAAVFLPAQSRWSPAAPMRAARFGASVVPLPDGTVLAVGGGPASAERYDPASDRWSVAGAVAFPVDTASLLADGRVLATGTRPGSQPQGGRPAMPDTGYAALYNPRTNRWSAASAPLARTQALATALPGGRLLLAGGSACLDFTPEDGCGRRDATATAQLYIPPSAAPVISRLRIRGRERRWPVVEYALNEPDSVTVVVERRLSGRRRGGRCVPGRGARGRRCTYRRRVGRPIVVAAGYGLTRLRLTDRRVGRRFAAGQYRITAAPAPVGDPGRAIRADF